MQIGTRFRTYEAAGSPSCGVEREVLIPGLGFCRREHRAAFGGLSAARLAETVSTRITRPERFKRLGGALPVLLSGLMLLVRSADRRMRCVGPA